MINNKRYLARFKVETATALAVGSGLTGLLNERLIAKDANGLPTIPGTALAGIVRHELLDPFIDSIDSAALAEKSILEQLLGFQNRENGEGQGSRINFSSAMLLAPDDGTVLEGLQKIDHSEAYYKVLRFLPERDHVRINHKGVAVKHAKFEEELVPKGTRFVFEIEMDGTKADANIWDKILGILNHPTFRVGAGTRKGFGALKIIECQTRIYDLSIADDLTAYLGVSARMNLPIQGAQDYKSTEQASKWRLYQVKLEPDHFFLFGAGLPEENINMPPKKERFFSWQTGKAVLTEDQYLVPATSIKGAFAHRLAFHWNKNEKVTIEKSGNYDPEKMEPVFELEAGLEELELGLDIDLMDYSPDAPEWRYWEEQIGALSMEDSTKWMMFRDHIEDLKSDRSTELYPVGEQNEAVKALMGFAKDSKQDEEVEKGARGKVIFSDIYIPSKDVKKKVFNHVAIDRFTGGGIDGALFQEEVISTTSLQLDIYVEKDIVEKPEYAKMKSAFDQTLDDLCQGRLQLGGNTTKGHGTFSGEWTLEKF